MKYIFFLFSALTSAQTFDSYGGWQQSPCNGGAAAHFYTEKVANKHWFCTPTGNHYFFQGVGGTFLSQLAINPVTKYGSNANWAVEQVNFFKSLNFNAIGELSEPILFPTTNTNKVPFIETIQQSTYATVNLNGYASRPIKNYMYGINGNFTAYAGAGCIDSFDPQYAVFATGLYAILSSYFASPYFVGMLGDDTDFICGMGASPAFQTILPGHTKGNPAFMTLLTSPKQTFNNGFTYSTTPIQYTDTKVYSKTAAASPPATCNITTPCTLRDYLAKKYGTIGALNTAWGSSYSTFDSAGTDVTAETCGTGNGSQTVFTCTLAHGDVSPLSVAVKIAGTLQGGDCPWFQSRCNVSGQTAPYTCASTGDCVGTFGGAAGTTIQTGYQPWAQDGQMTQVSNPGSGLPQGSYWFRTVWHGTNCPSAPSREIGNTYLSGEPQVTITTQNNAADIPGCATGVDIYMSCRVASGGATKGCVSAASGFPLETLQVSNVAYPGGSFTVPTSGLVAGAALPTAPSAIDYHTKSVQLTFSTAPANGASITLDYTYGGWMFGSGLMDEDGRHTTWVGTNPYCMTAAAGSTQGDENWACPNGGLPAVDANATFGADMNDWSAQWSAQYFKTARAAIKAAGPNTLYLGTDTAGDWGAPPRKEVIQGMAPYVDVPFWLWFANQTNNTIATAQYNYYSQWLGDKPMLNFLTLHAQPDSALAGNAESDCCFGLTTQPLRAAQWNTITTKMLNALSFNSTLQWVGTVWWGELDYNNEKINWGLKTSHDNPYNSRDAIAGSIACAPPLQVYTCGGEPAPLSPGVRPFGDLLSGVAAANSLWYNGTPPPPPTGVRRNKTSFF